MDVEKTRIPIEEVRSVVGAVTRKEFVYPAIFGVLVLIAWEVSVELLGLSAFTLPKPGRIASAIVSDRQIYLGKTLTSLKFIILGYVTGVLVGISFALLIYSSDLLERMLYPILVVFFIIPKIIVAPLFVLWLGAGSMYFTLIPLTLVFFPIVENTVSGLNGVPEDMKNLTRVLQSSTYFKYRNVLIPYALPSIAAGLKIGMRQAVIGVIVAEFVAPEQGLGQVLILGSQLGNPVVTWSGIVIIAFLGIALYKIIEITEQRTIFWKGNEQL